MLAGAGRARLAGVRHLAEEAAMSLPAQPDRRSSYDLADLVEDLGFSLMLFAGAAIALTVLALILVV
jgi:hypothetical protein